MNKIPATIKIDPRLKAKAQDAAKAEARTFSNYVEVALTEKMARDGQAKIGDS